MMARREEKLARPEDVAEEILRAVEADREEAYIGESRGLYWASRLAPGAIEGVNRL